MSKILVVDDQAVFREPIAAALRREGYATVCAADGRAGLQQTRDECPDLILLDVAMPKMDGLECLKALRKDPKSRGVPVIMLTALMERDVVAQAAQIGVQGYLLKSQFSLDDLLARVRKALGSIGDEKSASHAAERRPAPPKHQPTPTPAAGTDSPPRKSESHVLERIRREIQLRAMPPVLQYVIGLTNSQSSTLDEVAEAVRHDHVLALKVMKVANSSFFGTGKHAQNLKEAAQRLGLSGIRNCILAVLTIEHYSSASPGGLIPQRFWEHALATAALSQLMAQAIGVKHVDDRLFLAGLLHDIGRMILSIVFPEEYKKVLALAAERRVDLVVVEREVFETSHADVTKQVLTQWELPQCVVEAAWLHEHPVEHVQRAAREPHSALIVALANRLAYALALGNSANSMLLPIRDHAKALAIDGPALQAITRQALEKTTDTLLFYASQSAPAFREPLAAELAQMAGSPVRLAVLPGDAHADPLSLLCEQLGWLDSAQPQLAAIYAPNRGVLAAGLRELQKLEDAVGTKLALLVASPEGSVTPSPAELQGRHCVNLPIPGRYEGLVEAIARTRTACVDAG